MQSRVKSYETRIMHEIEEKEGLLNEIEEITDLKIVPLKYHKDRLIACREFSLRYDGSKAPVIKDLTFELMQGERVFWMGKMAVENPAL